MKSVSKLVSHVLEVLDGGGAHVRFREAIAEFPPKLRGARPPGCPHSGWQILEHMRIAQWDILRYSIDPRHRSPRWPKEYWPSSAEPPSRDAWQKSVKAFSVDFKALSKLLRDPRRDLLAPIEHAPAATLLGEAFLVANHNSYHTGQLVQLRRILGSWAPDPRTIVG